MELTDKQKEALGTLFDGLNGNQPRDYIMNELSSIFGVGGFSWKPENAPGTPDNGYTVVGTLKIAGDLQVHAYTMGAVARGANPEEADTRALALAVRPLGPAFWIPMRGSAGVAKAAPAANQGHAQKYQEMAARAGQDAPTGATFVFGRNKGDHLSTGSVADLTWYCEALSNSVNDPAKAKYQAKNKQDLIQAQIALQAAQGGNGGQTQPTQARGDGPPHPADRDGRDEFGDDDIPF